MKESNQSTVYDISSLTNILIWLLKASIFVSVIVLMSTLLELQLLNDIKTNTFDYDTIEDRANANDLRLVIIGLIQIGLFVITGIIFLRWIYFSNFNSGSLGANGMKFTPGWSIGWYFVPFMNFYKPYQAMKEIWKTSKDPNNWQSIETPSLIKEWWVLWIINSFLGRILYRLPTEEIDEMFLEGVIRIGAELVSISLSVIAIKMVSNICEMQKIHISAATTS